MQLARATQNRGFVFGPRFRVQIGDGITVGMGGDNLGLQHLSTVRTNRKERAVGLAAFRPQCRQHDVHDGVIAGQKRTQTIIKLARLVTVGGTDEFIFKPERIQKGLQPGIVVRTKRCMRSKRVFHSCQRHAQIGAQHLAIGDIVRHLAQPVHIVGKTQKAGFRTGQHFIGMAYHRGTHHFAKGADMRQTGRPVSGFKQHLAIPAG